MKLSRMAWNNVFRNVKSTALVLRRCFWAFPVSGRHRTIVWFKPENYVNQWGVSDFALTYSIHENEDLIPSEMVSEINQIDGTRNLRLTYAPYPQVTVDVLYDDTVFHDFLMSLDGVSGVDFSDSTELETYQQNFFSGILELIAHI